MGAATAGSGGAKDVKGWNSSDSAAYPANLNLYFANAIAALRAAGSQAPAARDALVAPTADAGVRSDGIPDRPVVKAPLPPTVEDQAAPVADASPSPPPPTAGITASDGTAQQLDFDGAEDDEDAVADAVSAVQARADAPAAPPARKTRQPRPVFQRGLGRHATRAAASAGAALLAIGAAGGARALCALGVANLAKPGAADPQSQPEAYAQDEKGWKISERSELKNHESNGSWEYIDRSRVPRGRRLVKLVWVYKIKRDGRLKSRLCVQGCRQVAGVDYDQTFCAAMRSTSLRLLSAVAARRGMRVRRWDFVAAYLQGELLPDEVVYCLPPPGYATKGKDGLDRVCKVKKPIYGMAQAGRRWQRTLFPWLKEYGFKQSESDPCVFTLDRTVDTPTGPRDEKLHLGVYVDDLAVCYDNDDEHSLYSHFTTALQERWKVDDEGDIRDLLGIEFDFTDGCVTLRQTAYIEKMVQDYFPDGVPTRIQINTTPSDVDLPSRVADALSQAEAPDPALVRRYQSVVGALLYCASNTRPDIAYSVGMLCRAMAKPTSELFDAALRVLAYLHRHRDIGLRYEASTSPLKGQSDSDWAVKHSTSGFTFDFSSATVSWGSKKQPSVALSSCEAEIMAASEAAKEGVYLRRFLSELGLGDDAPTELGLDNQGALALAYNPEMHARTKHIDRRHFYIRECVENMQLRVPFVKTADNMADFFTKPLPAKSFFRMRDIIMNVSARATHANEHLDRDGHALDSDHEDA